MKVAYFAKNMRKSLVANYDYRKGDCMGFASFMFKFYNWETMSSSKLLRYKAQTEELLMFPASDKDTGVMLDALTRIDAELDRRGIGANHSGGRYG